MNKLNEVYNPNAKFKVVAPHPIRRTETRVKGWFETEDEANKFLAAGNEPGWRVEPNVVRSSDSTKYQSKTEQPNDKAWTSLGTDGKTSYTNLTQDGNVVKSKDRQVKESIKISYAQFLKEARYKYEGVKYDIHAFRGPNHLPETIFSSKGPMTLLDCQDVIEHHQDMLHRAATILGKRVPAISYAVTANEPHEAPVHYNDVRRNIINTVAYNIHRDHQPEGTTDPADAQLWTQQSALGKPN